MKTILSNITIVCAIAILTISCGSGNDPVKTAVKYAEAYYDWDLKTCQQLMGSFYEDSELQFEQNMLNEEKHKTMKKILKKHNYSVKYNADNSQIEDDYAYIMLDVKTGIDKDATGDANISLKKVDGHWYVERMRAFTHVKTREEIMPLMK